MTAQECMAGGCVDDCWGAAGAAATAVMIYAHPPQLLACSLTTETAGDRCWGGGVGWGGGVVVL